MSTPFTIRSTDDRLTVQLVGKFDEPEAAALYQAMGAALTKLGTRPFVVLDLTGVTGSTILARAKLTDLQEFLAVRAKRTAWISNKPRFRGMALMVCHASADPNAKVVPNAELAEKWLGSDFDRINDIGKVVEDKVDSLRKLHKKQGSGGQS